MYRLGYTRLLSSRFGQAQAHPCSAGEPTPLLRLISGTDLFVKVYAPLRSLASLQSLILPAL